LRVQLHVLAVQSREDLARAFAAIQREGMGAFLVLSDPLLLGQVRSDMIAFALWHRLPAMYSAREYVEAGGFIMSYAPNFTAMWERAATNVDETLKGANPADLAIERGTLQLVVNLKAARALSFTIPTTLLFQAVEVIR
jgi:putative ABC transport system substrate-binding protein